MAQGSTAAQGPASPGKTPRTARGRETLRRLLDAAAAEFGESGFHDASISGITRRAGTALGSFYTYFDSKDAIFMALVRDMSSRVASASRAAIREGSTGLTLEREAFTGFLAFVREHKEVYRIIDEAEFANPASYRTHYEAIAALITARLEAGAAQGLLRPGDAEVRAWALMGMNVFLGLRYGVWDGERPIEDIAAVAGDMLGNGLAVGPR
nr:TetR/AcrR family transcriptional regulator [Novosphingobium lentum]